MGQLRLDADGFEDRSRTFGSIMRENDAKQAFARAMLEWQGFGPDDPDSGQARGLPKPEYNPNPGITPPDTRGDTAWAPATRARLALRLSVERRNRPEADPYRQALNDEWTRNGKPKWADGTPEVTNALAKWAINNLIDIPKGVADDARKA